MAERILKMKTGKRSRINDHENITISGIKLERDSQHNVRVLVEVHGGQLRHVSNFGWDVLTEQITADIIRNSPIEPKHRKAG